MTNREKGVFLARRVPGQKGYIRLRFTGTEMEGRGGVRSARGFARSSTRNAVPYGSTSFRCFLTWQDGKTARAAPSYGIFGKRDVTYSPSHSY